VTRLLRDETLEIPSWTVGMEKNTAIALNEPGTIADGQNFTPTQASRMATRGGSRMMLTLHNDAGSPAEVTGLCGVYPWTSIGGIVLGYDTAQHKCYAWFVTQDMALKGASEAASRVDLSLQPSGHVVSAAWTDSGGAPMPQASELWEGIFLADATLSIASRRWFLSLNQTVPTVQIGNPNANAKVPRFAFAGTGDSGTASAGGATTLTDATKAWTTNQFAGQSVTIVAGTGVGEVAIISSNTATQLTVPSWSIGTPDTTSQYVITPGIPQEIQPYCLETYNNVLFIAGYGDEAASNQDRPEYLRHSFLGRSPSMSLALGDVADGFDKDAWNIIGAKGQRITAMKQGRGLLLVAKANELYRISGAGRAYPGWQYATEMVMNTSGFGCANPNALCFAEGYWYGIGAAGMFRTDGFDVKPMVGPRKQDFLALDNLASTFCFYHPDRRVVLFGVHPQGTTPATYPWVLWQWDVERERWQPDWVQSTATAYAHGNVIPTTSVAGATAPPSAPSTTGVTTTGYTANWTVGDATAPVEFWQMDATLTWVLKATLAANTATYPVTGNPSHVQYQWKVRHVKNGLYSAYTAPQTVKTLIAAPTASVAGTPPNQNVTIFNNANGTPVNIFLYVVGGGLYTSWFTQQGPNEIDLPTGYLPAGQNWQVYAEDLAWSPVDSASTYFST